MVKIAPSLLSADFLNLRGEIQAAESAGADMLHIDIMDGHFVPNITIGPFVVEFIRKATRLPLDVHLMIERPDAYLKDFISAGADYLTVHAEATVHLHRSLQTIKEEGIMAGVSLNPATPVINLAHIMPDVDLVLIMSVNPGFGGQKFIPQSLEKIRATKTLRDEKKPDALIQVDGGVKPENALEIITAGADVLVMGSAFFQAEDYESVITSIRDLLPGR